MVTDNLAGEDWERRNLLGPLTDIPTSYLRDVAHLKRAVERWTMDGSFRTWFAEDSTAATASLGVDVPADAVAVLVDPDLARDFNEQVHCGDVGPHTLPVLRYRWFVEEKLRHRAELRDGGTPARSDLRLWRQRQANRCRGELGADRSASVVQAPMAIEVTKGCTVGCWFCGVAAPKYEHFWPYDQGAWKTGLASLRETAGPQVRYGFLYWATDPLDHPDYERLLVDFHQVTGRCPQTTTAIAHRDVARTRQILRTAHRLDSEVDRFSITTLRALDAVHDGFSPEELLRVELVPQNKEATTAHRKSNAGRARKWTDRKQAELVPDGQSSTIACVSGFLINMVDGTVKLITPCDANDRWPLGYWIYGSERFRSPHELGDIADQLIRDHCRPMLRPGDRVRLHPRVHAQLSGPTEATVRFGDITLRFQDQASPAALVEMLSSGTETVRDFAGHRAVRDGVPYERTVALLEVLLTSGCLDDEPPVGAETGQAATVRLRPGQGSARAEHRPTATSAPTPA